MHIIIGMLGLGSLIIAFLITWQVKVIEPIFSDVIKYNLYIIPLMFVANLSLGMGFIKGHQIYKNLSFLIATQTFIYYLLILFFSTTILGDKLSIFKAILGFTLIVIGIWVLKS